MGCNGVLVGLFMPTVFCGVLLCLVRRWTNLLCLVLCLYVGFTEDDGWLSVLDVVLVEAT